jgi:hypothetical protein
MIVDPSRQTPTVLFWSILPINLIISELHAKNLAKIDEIFIRLKHFKVSVV